MQPESEFRDAKPKLNLNTIMYRKISEKIIITLNNSLTVYPRTLPFMLSLLSGTGTQYRTTAVELIPSASWIFGDATGTARSRSNVHQDEYSLRKFSPRVIYSDFAPSKMMKTLLEKKLEF